MTDMKGRVALVTGAGSGMGRSMAQMFAKRGAAVVVADINIENGRSTVEQVAKDGGEALFVRTDVSIEGDARTLVEATLAAFGRLDFAVNNAGFDGDVLPLAEQSAATFSKVIAVNLMGVFFGLK